MNNPTRVGLSEDWKVTSKSSVRDPMVVGWVFDACVLPTDAISFALPSKTDKCIERIHLVKSEMLSAFPRVIAVFWAFIEDAKKLLAIQKYIVDLQAKVMMKDVRFSQKERELESTKKKLSEKLDEALRRLGEVLEEQRALEKRARVPEGMVVSNFRKSPGFVEEVVWHSSSGCKKTLRRLVDKLRELVPRVDPTRIQV